MFYLIQLKHRSIAVFSYFSVVANKFNKEDFCDPLRIFIKNRFFFTFISCYLHFLKKKFFVSYYCIKFLQKCFQLFSLTFFWKKKNNSNYIYNGIILSNDQIYSHIPPKILCIIIIAVWKKKVHFRCSMSSYNWQQIVSNSWITVDGCEWQPYG